MNRANSFGLTLVRQMHIKNLHMPVRKVVPELDGKFAEDVNFHSATSRIVLNKVGKLGGKCCNLTKVIETLSLLL